jgi:non-specific serine/threonine protein kinase
MTTFHSLKLKKYVLNNTFPDIVARGRKMLGDKLCTLDSLDPTGPGKAVFKVRSDSEDKVYRVEVSGFKSGTLKSSCTCPYDWGGICKHRVAAIHLLDNKLQQVENGPASIVFQMLDSVAFLPALGDAALRVNCRDDDWKAVAKLPERVVVKQALNGFAECELTYKKTPYTIRLTGQAKDLVHTACSCNESLLYPLCLHKVAALLKIREQFGPNAFTMMRDWTDDKRRLLAEYGYTLDDDLKGKFDFRVNDKKGELELVLRDASLHKLDADWQGLGQSLLGRAGGPAAPVVGKAEESIHLIYALECAGPLGLPGLKLTPLTCKINPKTGKMTHVRQLSQLQGGSLPVVGPEDTRNIRLGGLLTVEGLIKHLQEAGQLPHHGWYGYDFEAKLSEEARTEARRYEGALLDELFNGMAGKRTYEQARSSYSYSAETLSPVALSPVRLRPEFVVKEEKDLVSVEMFVRVNDKSVPFAHFGYRSFWVVYHLGVFYKFAGLAEANLFRYFSEHGAVRVKRERLPEFLAGFVLPLGERCDLDLKLSQPVREADLQFTGHRLYLKEDEENLLLAPATAYGADGEAVECTPDGRQYRFTETDGQVTRWRRDAAREGEGYDLVKALHPDFEGQAGRQSFAVPFAEVLRENWLFKAVEQMHAQGVEVLGQSTLKKIRYNLNRPTFQMRTSSGIDWFDVKVEIRFGDQLASLADVRKALLKKENYVTLGDGTLGMLPEEWLHKYAGMLRVGEVDGDTVKVSKLHFSVIDALYNEIDSLEVQRELYEKRQKLLNFKEIADVPAPANVKAQLRDYQREGFKWLHFLDEFGWGGCLADDMGLGKTLQVLTFLQERQNRAPDATNLVVVPTTLLSNWEAEAAKFCPDLKTQVYRGATRQWSTDLFDEFDLVITTYGTVRSDIEKLRQYRFHYVVLDESQAIKNPSSQVAKAVKLLRADNRIVMTGTPVENNTFDLYSQMDFLNPGLLGSEAFFRTEYATPIDKHRNEEKARELRGLIYPFMLKRTKEEVAKDLPDKTEIVLHCEMGKAQRKVYEKFRETYRLKITDKMSRDGKEKASFLILEGLLKLRQICDSPALLSDSEDYGHDSAKLDELVREINENAGHHKILVFSQFLKMLDLVREHLEAVRIPYEYLDGSTEDRAERVRSFQENEQCRVFLISLKAGGVGLNLTSADYVYLIDPWWNPAVEQQAIDRTHRIGQTQKVFAYKMICKDTVEEKILALQEKKREVADDLISTESGFIKKLTQEDIVGLFS